MNDKFKLIWDIIFNYNKFLFRNKKEIVSEIMDFKKSCTEKLDFLVFDAEMKGLCNHTGLRTVRLYGQHIRGIDHKTTVTEISKIVNPWSVFYEGIPAHTMKNEAARALAEQLVKLDFIRTRPTPNPNVIEFYINVFE